MFFFLCPVLDVYSRKIVAHEAHEAKSAGQAASLIRQAPGREGLIGQAACPSSGQWQSPEGLDLHRPGYPGAFASLEDARTWVLSFTRRYNHEHRQRALEFVSPGERHAGRDAAIFAHRAGVTEAARKRHPER